jgi:hypothetical protein
MLRDFSAKDMIEQIVLLDEIKESGRTDLLPELMALYATPQHDQAVDEIIYHTLFALLAQDHEAVKAGLRHPAERVRLVAVRRAGEDLVPGALTILVEQLQTPMAPETLASTIKAVSQYGVPALTELIVPFIDHDDEAVAASAMHGLVALHGASGREALLALLDKNGASALKRAQALSCLAEKEMKG